MRLGRPTGAASVLLAVAALSLSGCSFLTYDRKSVQLACWITNDFELPEGRRMTRRMVPGTFEPSPRCYDRDGSLECPSP